MENFNKKAKVNDFAAYRGLLLTVSMSLAPFCFHIPTASGFHAAQYSYMSGKLIGPMLSFVCEDAVFQMRKCCFIVNTIIIFTIQRLFAENLRSCGTISRPAASFAPPPPVCLHSLLYGSSWSLLSPFVIKSVLKSNFLSDQTSG